MPSKRAKPKSILLNACNVKLTLCDFRIPKDNTVTRPQNCCKFFRKPTDTYHDLTKLTINIPVVYMVRYVVVLSGANP